MKLNTLAEKNATFVDWIVKNIAKEMSGMKRMNYSFQLAEIVGGSKDEILRAVEAITKAKDKGMALSIINQHTEE